MKGLIVVVEGLERTGKTTLCKEFEKRGFVYFKDFNRINKHICMGMESRLDTTLTFLQNLSENGVNVVVDRLHLSEYAYGKIFRKEYSANVNYIDNAISKLNSVLILCKSDNDEEYKNRMLLKYTTNQVEQLSNRFEYYFEKSEIKNKFEYEFIKYDVSKYVNYIFEQINYYEYDFYLASPFFKDTQIQREEAVKKLLRNKYYTVYSPRENGVLTPDATDEVRTKIFKENCEAIQKSHRILAITDEKDIGTIWEAGYAYGIGKEVVYYAETLGDNPFNVMLGKSGIGIFTKYNDLVEAAEANMFYNKNEKGLNVQ
jgi:nucleoside 2-deoxyribosyltransferase/thymidylate kinase